MLGTPQEGQAKLRSLARRRFGFRIVGAALFAAACGPSIQARMETAQGSSCGKVIANHPAIVKEPDYAKQSVTTRELYEIRVAECYLGEHKPEKAMELARRWTRSDLEGELEVKARVYAAVGNDMAARAILESMRGPHHPITPELLAETPEFHRYAEEDWFVKLAVHSWSQTGSDDFERFALHLFRNRSLLPLPVAVADSSRRAGEWAVWTGIVRNAQIDRDGNSTRLVVESVEVKSELRVMDRHVQSVETTGVNLPFGVWHSGATPTYKTEKVYEQVFVPTGQQFLLRYPGTNENLVRMRVVTAIGRYGGREEDGRPVLAAVAIVERKPKETTVTDTEK